MDYDILSKIPGCTWRVMHPEDAPALHNFELVCSQVDGATQVSTQATWQQKLADESHTATSSILVSKADGQIIAAGWIEYSNEFEEVRAFLDGRVHPDFRRQGIGSSLLSWLETHARQHLGIIAGGRRQVLRILFYDRPPDAIELYKRHGFDFLYAEDEMSYNLHETLPEYPLPVEMNFHTWTPESAGDFYKVYADAFLTRTYEIKSEQAWAYHFTNLEDEEFQPDLSLLVKEGENPVAFTVCHIEPTGDEKHPKEAWITQMGVRQARRGRGIALALLVECMRRMVKEGYTVAMLSVNVNNPQARRIYGCVGFGFTKRFTIYAKEVKE